MTKPMRNKEKLVRISKAELFVLIKGWGGGENSSVY